MKTETVTVGLDARSYDIIIGPKLIEQARKMLAARLPGARVAIVTDSNIGMAWLPALQASLVEQRIDTTPAVVAAGEKSKSFFLLEHVIDRLLAAKLECGDCVIALGGGVVGDLVGFAAGIVRRGIGFVQMAISLLA